MRLRLTRNQIIIIAGGLFLIIVLVLIIIFFRRQSAGPVGGVTGEIVVWGVFDNKRNMKTVIDTYNQKSPGVKVIYIEKDPNTYEQDLVNALATPNAPDVFMIHNTWLPKHVNKFLALPAGAMNFEDYRALYPDTVIQDFAPDGRIYALPLYLDTLALFYNEEIFDQAGIPLPPRTWEEFQALIPKLREVDPRTGRIKKAAAAIGGSNQSVNRASDLLSLLMLQTGTEMVSGGKIDSLSFNSPSGVEALQFYTSFADPKNPYFTWDDTFMYSIDGFAAEDVAMMFNYSHQAALLKQKNPFLKFAVAAMPQPASSTSAVNYPNYWGFAVGAKSKSWRAGWNFVLSLAREPAVARAYLEATGRPPALRTLINETLNKPALEVFARAALTARSWPQIDNVVVENSFSEAIKAVLSGRPALNALGEARAKIRRVARPEQ